MRRRDFLRGLGVGIGAVATGASPARTETRAATPPAIGGVIQTVRGPVPAAELGFTLPHEHVLVDFVGADQVSPARYDADRVFEAVLPPLRQAHELGVRALGECTPEFLGRDPRLLRRLGEATGLHLITNTGLYGVRQDKFLPPYAHTESAAQLAQRWGREFREGIAGTGIRPGFIKSGVDPEPALSATHRKLVTAAALTHRATGLAIAVHTGRGPGLAQLDILRENGVAASAFIWVHAQGARDDDLFAAAERGAWISLDGLNRNSLPRHRHLCVELRRRGHLGQILLSHDAGWFDPAKEGGGVFRPFDLLVPVFLPQLREAGFTADEIDLVTRINPARALAVRPV